jgi:hypothetical protein
MYKPAGGIWIPVGSMTWGWGGTATYTRGVNMNLFAESNLLVWTGTQFSPSPNPYIPSYVASSSNADFPTWKHAIQETKEVKLS